MGGGLSEIHLKPCAQKHGERAVVVYGEWDHVSRRGTGGGGLVQTSGSLFQPLWDSQDLTQAQKNNN